VRWLGRDTIDWFADVVDSISVLTARPRKLVEFGVILTLFVSQGVIL
jgi:hypothetical protein